ncbi:hypothetical protein V6N11_000296 [Hibiscus sabdariffa]|uniref:Uncharacterized protein n=2 Tax=Hibiscus sabdariffa TaxID=183260 RepID=A0ABR2NFR9_9ROSI
MVGSGVETSLVSFQLEDFPPLVAAQASDGVGPEAIGIEIDGAKAVVDVGTVAVAEVEALGDAAQPNQDIGSDTLVSIVVEVVWSPPRCKHCMIFCHSDENCGNIVHKGVVDSGFTVVPGVDAQGQDVSYIVKVVDPGLVSNEASMVDYVEHAGTVCAEVDFAPLPKEVEKGGGIRLSVCGKPSNSFEALSVGIVEECVLPVDESELDSPKKRIAAGGVAELLQQLKPQAKEAKAKKKGKGKGGERKGGSPVQ